MSLTIRAAALADLASIVAFNQAMARETEGRDLDQERLSRGVLAVLSDAAKGRYLVAQSDGEVVGCLLLTYEWSDWRNGCFHWIQSVYVHPEHRRRGVYRALYAEVERLAQASGESCGLRLYVEKTNLAGRRTYEALGMEETDYRIYEREFRGGAG